MRGVDIDARAEVARILTEHWDPLRVAETDEVPESEYLHEADRVLALLQGGADVEVVAAYLSVAASELSSRGDPARDRQTADALVAWQRARA
jgi:ABC-type sugar transport system ATPase subunit